MGPHNTSWGPHNTSQQPHNASPQPCWPRREVPTRCHLPPPPRPAAPHHLWGGRSFPYSFVSAASAADGAAALIKKKPSRTEMPFVGLQRAAACCDWHPYCWVNFVGNIGLSGLLPGAPARPQIYGGCGHSCPCARGLRGAGGGRAAPAPTGGAPRKAGEGSPSELRVH